MYTKDLLREYISNSELRIYNDKIKVRLSKELAIKYDNGEYNNYLKKLEKYYGMINDLNIVYPSNANPILYLYIVPDDNYEELLGIPKEFIGKNGGGKPVTCYDIDGFNSAYGVSQGLCNDNGNKDSISYMVNNIHELVHVVHNQFSFRDRMICEGFAEAVPLYVMGLEDEFDEHRDALINIDESKIDSAKELFDSSRNGTYGVEALIPGRSCSFRLSYISSYLFIRFCLEEIRRKFNLDERESMMFFLNFIKTNKNSDEWLIYDIADLLDIDREELFCSKKYQLEVIDNIRKSNKTKK